MEGFFWEFVFSGIKIFFIPLKYSLRLHCNTKWILLANDISRGLNNLDNITKFSFLSEEEDNLLCKLLHPKFWLVCFLMSPVSFCVSLCALEDVVNIIFYCQRFEQLSSGHHQLYNHLSERKCGVCRGGCSHKNVFLHCKENETIFNFSLSVSANINYHDKNECFHCLLHDLESATTPSWSWLSVFGTIAENVDGKNRHWMWIGTNIFS